jgi:hypothetical protein
VFCVAAFRHRCCLFIAAQFRLGRPPSMSSEVLEEIKMLADDMTLNP